MAVGKGGQSGNQNQSGSYTGNSSTTTAPIISDNWNNAYTGALGNLGTTGVNPMQQGFISGLGSNKPNLSDVTRGMDAYKNAGYYSLQDLSKNFGGEWATPDPVAAQMVSARTGAEFMNAYKNPFDKDVIDASIADYNANADRSLNAMRAGRDASGAFGDRAAIADAVFNADAARGLGSMVGGLRQQGFNTAAGLGMADANRFLTADTGNADRRLQADTFNNNMTNNRQQFSVNQAMQGDAQRMQALRDLRDTALAGSAENRANILAQSGIASGGLSQLTNLLNLGTSTFGQQSNTSGSGSSQNAGSSKSKGGGISLG